MSVTRAITTATTLALYTLPVQADETYRVFVGDHQAPQVTAFDLSAPETRWTFPTSGQAKLYPVAHGAVVAAVQSDDDTVQFLDSGLRLTSQMTAVKDNRILIVDAEAMHASIQLVDGLEALTKGMEALSE